MAAAGAGVGGALWLLAELDWATWLLLLGALLHTQLALGLASPALARVRLLALPAAILLAAAFTWEIAWLAAPWLAFTICCGLFGLWRMVKLGLRRAEALADWGLVMFAVSGAWTFAAAMGWAVFGFPPIIVLLAGVHQLYAGLILQVIASRIVAAAPGRRVPGTVGALVSVGNLLVAFGILATHAKAPPVFEFAAVCIYASSVIVLGWMQLYLALAPSSGLPWYSRVLLVISDLSLGTAMTLAIIFAWGTQRGVPTLTIPEMITWHGTLNVFGFALCALLGWTLADHSGKNQRNTPVSAD
jgi:hypothetical protein